MGVSVGRCFVSHAGGKAEEGEKGSGFVLKESQGVGDLVVGALRRTRGPVLVGDRYVHRPKCLELRGRFNYLGFYRVALSWPALEANNKVRFKFLFVWCESQGGPWWLNEDEPTKVGKEKKRGEIREWVCRVCGGTFLWIYVVPLCLDERCLAFFKRPPQSVLDGDEQEGLEGYVRFGVEDGMGAEEVYHPLFLSNDWKTTSQAPNPDSDLFFPTPDAQDFFSSCPPLQAPTPFHHPHPLLSSSLNPNPRLCTHCNLISLRSNWSFWKCEGCDAPPQPFDFTPLIESPNFGFHCTPRPTHPARHHPSITHVRVEFQFENCRTAGKVADVYTLACGGRVVHVHDPESCCLPFSLKSRTEKGGADEILEDLLKEEGGLDLRRWRVDRHKVNDFRSKHFVLNIGHPYKYTHQTPELPFTESPLGVQKAARFLKRVLEGVCGQSAFNEMLVVGYLRGQKMNFHADDEPGITGPIASLSLGSDAVFSLRPNEKKESQVMGRGGKTKKGKDVGVVEGVVAGPPKPKKSWKKKKMKADAHTMLDADAAESLLRLQRAPPPTPQTHAAASALLAIKQTLSFSNLMLPEPHFHHQQQQQVKPLQPVEPAVSLFPHHYLQPHLQHSSARPSPLSFNLSGLVSNLSTRPPYENDMRKPVASDSFAKEVMCNQEQVLEEGRTFLAESSTTTEKPSGLDRSWRSVVGLLPLSSEEGWKGFDHRATSTTGVRCWPSEASSASPSATLSLTKLSLDPVKVELQHSETFALDHPKVETPPLESTSVPDAAKVSIPQKRKRGRPPKLKPGGKNNLLTPSSDVSAAKEASSSSPSTRTLSINRKPRRLLKIEKNERTVDKTSPNLLAQRPPAPKSSSAAPWKKKNATGRDVSQLSETPSSTLKRKARRPRKVKALDVDDGVSATSEAVSGMNKTGGSDAAMDASTAGLALPVIVEAKEGGEADKKARDEGKEHEKDKRAKVEKAWTKKTVLQIHLRHGDVLIMDGANIQKSYKHSIEGVEGLRIAITARKIYDSPPLVP
ncbi:hypothetical protein HDV05_006265 [Chytridiales sp. JEL 0842]|nr:hypothetical protein HDV05_006265 [Chytridiales sp. JEL 0842]